MYRMCTGFVKRSKKRHKDKQRQNAGSLENTNVSQRWKKPEKTIWRAGSVGVRSSNLLCSTKAGEADKSSSPAFPLPLIYETKNGLKKPIVYRLCTGFYFCDPVVCFYRMCTGQGGGSYLLLILPDCRRFADCDIVCWYSAICGIIWLKEPINAKKRSSCFQNPYL